MTESDAVAEAPWFLDVNAVRIASGTASPARADAMAAGRLLADGYITQRGQLSSLVVRSLAGGIVDIHATIEPARFDAGREEAAHRTAHGCGLLHFVQCDAMAARRVRQGVLPDANTSAQLLRTLFANCDDASPAGGVHGAMLVCGGLMREAMVDVSRHAAVEKAVGAAFLDGLALGEYGVVLTARISGQIALTAARAGAAWVASRSVATTLAIAIAAAARLPLIMRAAGRDRSTFAAFP